MTTITSKSGKGLRARERESKKISRKCGKQRLLYFEEKKEGERAREWEKMCGSFPSQFGAIIVKVNEYDGKYENALLLHDFSIIFFSFHTYMLIIDVWCVWIWKNKFIPFAFAALETPHIYMWKRASFTFVIHNHL